MTAPDPLEAVLGNAVIGSGQDDYGHIYNWPLYWETLARAAREHIAAEIEAVDVDPYDTTYPDGIVEGMRRAARVARKAGPLQEDKP